MKYLLIPLLAVCAVAQGPAATGDQVTAAWTSATTAGASGATLTVPATGYGTAAIGFVASGTITGGVVTFEATTATDGNSGWVTAGCIEINTTATLDTTYTLTGANQVWQCSVAGANWFRVRLSTAITGSGTANFTGQATTARATGKGGGGSGITQLTGKVLAGPGSGSQAASLNVTGHDIAGPLACADTSASGSVQVCNTSPTFTPASGDCVLYTTTTANTGASLTLNVNSLGAKPVAKWQGATTLAANDVLANKQLLACYDGTNWEIPTIGNAPAGSATGNAGFNVSVNAGVFTATPTYTCPSATAGTVGMFVVPTLTGNVTSSTLATCTGSASLTSDLTFSFTQDATGGRTVAMPTGFDSCPVHPAANIRTTCTYTWDGTTGRLAAGPVGTAGYSSGSEVAAPGTPPTGVCFSWFDSTDHAYHDKCNNTTTVRTTVVSGTLATHNFATAISAAGVFSGAQPAFTDISGTATTAQLPTAANTRTASLTDLSPVSGDSGLLLVINPATAIHLTRAFCAVQGTTNVVINLDKRTEAAIGTDTGNHLLGADLTAVSGGANTATFANGAGQCGGTGSCAIAAHAPVVMTFTSVSGTPTALDCSIDYTVD